MVEHREAEEGEGVPTRVCICVCGGAEVTWPWGGRGATSGARDLMSASAAAASARASPRLGCADARASALRPTHFTRFTSPRNRSQSTPAAPSAAPAPPSGATCLTTVRSIVTPRELTSPSSPAGSSMRSTCIRFTSRPWIESSASVRCTASRGATLPTCAAARTPLAYCGQARARLGGSLPRTAAVSSAVPSSCSYSVSTSTATSSVPATSCAPRRPRGQPAGYTLRDGSGGGRARSRGASACGRVVRRAGRRSPPGTGG